MGNGAVGWRKRQAPTGIARAAQLQSLAIRLHLGLNVVFNLLVTKIVSLSLNIVKVLSTQLSQLQCQVSPL
mgnify:CR=1